MTRRVQGKDKHDWSAVAGNRHDTNLEVKALDPAVEFDVAV